MTPTKVILFKDGSKKVLDEKQARAFDTWLFPIDEETVQPEFTLVENGHRNKFYAHDIRRYLDYAEYQAEYPQFEGGVATRDTFPKEYLPASKVMSNPARLARSKRAAEQMLKAFDSAIKEIHESYKNVSQETRDMRKKMVQAIKSHE